MEGCIREYARKAAAKVKADRAVQGRKPSSPGRRYIGVRSRPGNKFGADIWDPTTNKRVWLGTYDTKEEAACAYGFAALSLKPDANFPDLGEDEEETAVAVLAHFAATKRERAEKLVERAARKMEVAEAAVAAARDAVATVPPTTAPAPAGDVVDATSFPGEEDVVAALMILQRQEEGPSCKTKKAG